MFAGARPTFVSVGEITFKAPVEVGDLLRLYSRVLLTTLDPDMKHVCAHKHDSTTCTECCWNNQLFTCSASACACTFIHGGKLYVSAYRICNHVQALCAKT
jgi:hypothetical protein